MNAVLSESQAEANAAAPAFPEKKKRARRKRLNRAPEIDHGTPELQRKRAALVGSCDQTKSDHVLGVLLERGVLTLDQYSAGKRYRYLMAIGTGDPKLCPGDGMVDQKLFGKDADDLKKKQTTQWLRACETLLRVGRIAKNVVDDAAVFDRMPTWARRMTGQPAGPHVRKAEQREMFALVLGLQRLVEIGCVQVESETA